MHIHAYIAVVRMYACCLRVQHSDYLPTDLFQLKRSAPGCMEGLMRSNTRHDACCTCFYFLLINPVIWLQVAVRKLQMRVRVTFQSDLQGQTCMRIANLIAMHRHIYIHLCGKLSQLSKASLARRTLLVDNKPHTHTHTHTNVRYLRDMLARRTCEIWSAYPVLLTTVYLGTMLITLLREKLPLPSWNDRPSSYSGRDFFSDGMSDGKPRACNTPVVPILSREKGSLQSEPLTAKTARLPVRSNES
jgi:hypothetical protein